jgi:pimeloyl-ACP methyl ester carboxylesterase
MLAPRAALFGLLLSLTACPKHEPWMETYATWGLEGGRTEAGLRYHMRWAPGPGVPPLVLLHGNFDSVDSWPAVVAALPPSVPLVLLEIPGFGTSPALEASGPAEHAAAIAAALEELQLPKVVLAGHSLGGMLAAHVAQRHPERVAHLVMISAGFINAVDRPEIVEQVGAVLNLASATGLPPSGPDDILAGPVQALLLDAVAKDERVDGPLVRQYEERVVQCVGSAARLSGGDWPLPEPPERMPITAIHGWEDRWVSVSNATTAGKFGLVQEAPRHYFLLNDSGHLPQVEQPEDLARILGATTKKGALDKLPACMGEGLVDPGEHPRGSHLRRRAFGGAWPEACVGAGPPPVESMTCDQLVTACGELQEPACARLIRLQSKDHCAVQACEPITKLYDPPCMNEESGEACWYMGTARLYGLCGFINGTSDTKLFFDEGCLQGHQPSCEEYEKVEEIWKQREPPPYEHRGGLL